MQANHNLPHTQGPTPSTPSKQCLPRQAAFINSNEKNNYIFLQKKIIVNKFQAIKDSETALAKKKPTLHTDTHTSLWKLYREHSRPVGPQRLVKNWIPAQETSNGGTKDDFDPPILKNGRNYA